MNVFDTLLLPHQIVGRYLNASGEVLYHYPANYQYNADGRLSFFSFPRGNVGAHFYYDNQHISSVTFSAGSNLDDESCVITWDFAYENGLIQTEHKRTVELYQGYDNTEDEYLYYTYDELGRLKIKERVYDYYLNNRWSYEYDHQGKTIVVTCLGFWGGQLSHLESVTTYQYDDDYVLQEVHMDLYDNASHLSQTTRQLYTYTEQRKLASKITQDLVDGEWVNSKIHQNLYDAYGKLSEQLDGCWSDSLDTWEYTFKVDYEYSMSDNIYTVSFYKKSGEDWAWGNSYGYAVFLDPELKWQQEMLNRIYTFNQLEFTTTCKLLPAFPENSEWYYEIQGEDGENTYQQLKCAGDTTINDERAKVIVRTNQIYDKDGQIEVTREYVCERDSVVYWWNKSLHEFTTLYDLAAEVGDEWEIKVGTTSLVMHVDAIEDYEYEGTIRKMMHVSDVDHLFSGDIVVGFGHMTSFFPEKLMDKKSNYEVNGLRCYWFNDELIFHNGDEDCDAVYSEIHAVDELETEGFRIYPNPTEGLITIERYDTSSGQTSGYRISNLLGQTLLVGRLEGEHPQVDVAALPSGMYFLTIGERTLKFTKQ